MKERTVVRFKNSGYVFLLPALVFFAFFVVYPVGFIVFGSLFKWSSLSSMTFVGLDQYAKLFHDTVFGIVLRNSAFWIVCTVLIQMAFGFLLAYVIEEKLIHFKGVFRTVLFIPVVTSVVVIGVLFKNMFSPYQGLLTNILYSLGVKPPIDWIGNVHSAIFALIVVNIWEWTGWSMLLYVAGFSQIPNEIKEASSIDGANSIQTIFHLFLPMLASVHKSLVMLGIIGSLQTFALVYSITSGGPNSASEMPGTYIFKTGFKVQQMGYASAISVVILLIALVLTVLQVVTIGSGNFFGKESE